MYAHTYVLIELKTEFEEQAVEFLGGCEKQSKLPYAFFPRERTHNICDQDAPTVPPCLQQLSACSLSSEAGVIQIKPTETRVCARLDCTKLGAQLESRIAIGAHKAYFHELDTCVRRRNKKYL